MLYKTFKIISVELNKTNLSYRLILVNCVNNFNYPFDVYTFTIFVV